MRPPEPFRGPLPTAEIPDLIRTRTVFQEVWGVRLAGGQIRTTGFSGWPLHSEEDVRKDFDRSLFEAGARPILLRKVTETIEFYTEEI